MDHTEASFLARISGDLMSPIKFDDISRPRQLILNSLTLGLTRRPKLQIFDTIVRTIAVDVVNLFLPKKRSTNRLLHHFPMLPNLLTANTGPVRSVDIAASIHSPGVDMVRVVSGDCSRTCPPALSFVVHVAHSLSEEGPIALFDATDSHFASLSHGGKW